MSRINCSAEAASVSSVLPTIATLRPARAATVSMGRIMSEPCTKPTGRPASRDSQTMGLPSAQIISWRA